MKTWNRVGTVFTLDDGFLVLPVPVLKLGLELDGDELKVTRVVVPREVAVHTDDVHVWSLVRGKAQRVLNERKGFKCEVRWLSG